MNDQVICEEIVAVLLSEAFADFANTFVTATSPAAQIHPAQDASLLKRPTLTVSATFNPYGTKRKGTITFEIRSRVGDENGEEKPHQTRTEALMNTLLGANGGALAANRAAAKAALIDALTARGNVTLLDYGPHRDDAFEMNFDGVDLVTRMVLSAVAVFLT